MTCVYVPDLRHCVPRKPVFFHPGARAEILETSGTVRKKLGDLLWELQQGHALTMPHSRPMPIVALGVEELRVKDESGQYRAFLVRKTREASLYCTSSVRSREAHLAAQLNWHGGV